MKLKIAGSEVRYEVSGEGEALLLLHAFPLSLEMWDAQAAAFATTQRVVRFDARGFGGSPPTEGILTMERIAEDAVALLDHLGIDRAIVVGASMGGYAAFALLRKHAERVCGLVLVDTRADADTPQGRKQRSELAERVRREGALAAAEAFLPKLLGQTTTAERPQLVEQVRRMILAAPAQGIVDALMGIAARADATPLLREIRVPTLVVCGAEDEITPRAGAEALGEQIAGARLAVIPKAGHLPNLETPPAFEAALSQFLLSLD